MANAKHQAAWRTNSPKTRVEVYLQANELAQLDAMSGTRAEAIRGLLSDNHALPKNERESLPEIPDDVTLTLRKAFPSPDGAGIDWPKVAEAATAMQSRRRAAVEYAKQKRADGGDTWVDTTASMRQRKRREKGTLKTGIPEVVKAMQDGAITVNSAWSIAQRPADQQSAALEKALRFTRRRTMKLSSSAMA